jgi:hypothetical protein
MINNATVHRSTWSRVAQMLRLLLGGGGITEPLRLANRAQMKTRINAAAKSISSGPRKIANCDSNAISSVIV